MFTSPPTVINTHKGSLGRHVPNRNYLLLQEMYLTILKVETFHEILCQL